MRSRPVAGPLRPVYPGAAGSRAGGQPALSTPGLERLARVVHNRRRIAADLLLAGPRCSHAMHRDPATDDRRGRRRLVGSSRGWRRRPGSCRDVGLDVAAARPTTGAPAVPATTDAVRRRSSRRRSRRTDRDTGSGRGRGCCVLRRAAGRPRCRHGHAWSAAHDVRAGGGRGTARTAGDARRADRLARRPDRSLRHRRAVPALGSAPRRDLPRSAAASRRCSGATAAALPRNTDDGPWCPDEGRSRTSRHHRQSPGPHRGDMAPEPPAANRAANTGRHRASAAGQQDSAGGGAGGRSRDGRRCRAAEMTSSHADSQSFWSASLPRSCSTALVCIWQIRLSVTPSTWPISASVRFS